jgi:bla regulator protein blaR1
MNCLARALSALALAAFLATAAAGQNQPAPSAFTVASIRPTAVNDDGFSYRGLPGGELIATGVTLKLLIMEAYGVRAYQVSGGPGWIGSDRWDIQAKPEGVQGRLSSAQHGLMLRALLEDRFQLKVHRETREIPVYALVIGKNGAKLTAPADPAARGGKAAPGAWDLRNTTIPALTAQLSRQLSRTVIDKTGLNDRYDVKLDWTPERGEGGAETLGLPPSLDAPAPTASSGPSIFTAIQEQLGLKLESAKGPVEIVVIDRAEKPSAN